MIETKDADRIGTQPTAAAAARSAAVAPGLARGVFIGWSRPSVHTTRLASTRRPARRRRRVRRPGARPASRRPSASGRCRRRAARPGRARGSAPARCRPRTRRRRRCLRQVYDVEVARTLAAAARRCRRCEALSTTTTWPARSVWARSAASDSTSRSRRFQVTTTATTRCTPTARRALTSAHRSPGGRSVSRQLDRSVGLRWRRSRRAGCRSSRRRCCLPGLGEALPGRRRGLLRRRLALGAVDRGLHHAPGSCRCRGGRW